MHIFYEASSVAPIKTCINIDWQNSKTPQFRLQYQKNITISNTKTQRMSMENDVLNTNEINHDRIKRGFLSVGFSERDYISSADLQQCLDKLSGEEFDRDVLEQLWEQCKLNSHGNTKITNFIDNLIRAEAILIQKQKETSASIKNLEQKLASNSVSNAEKMELNLQYNDLLELRAGFKTDLQIIRKPFRKFVMQSVVSSAGLPTQNYKTALIDESVYTPLNSLPINIENKNSLTIVFYLSCICILAQFLVYLQLNAFMNTVLFLLMLSLFFYEHFDRRSIRFLFWFTCFTLLVDIVWFVVSAKVVWHTKEIGMWPKYLSGYLKLCVIVIAIVSFLKIIIGILLCTQYNIDESQPQEIYIFGRRLVLKSTNMDAPLKKALFELGMKSPEKEKKAGVKPFEELELEL